MSRVWARGARNRPVCSRRVSSIINHTATPATLPAMGMSRNGHSMPNADVSDEANTAVPKLRAGFAPTPVTGKTVHGDAIAALALARRAAETERRGRYAGPSLWVLPGLDVD